MQRLLKGPELDVKDSSVISANAILISFNLGKDPKADKRCSEEPRGLEDRSIRISVVGNAKSTEFAVIWLCAASRFTSRGSVELDLEMVGV